VTNDRQAVGIRRSAVLYAVVLVSLKKVPSWTVANFGPIAMIRTIRRSSLMLATANRTVRNLPLMKETVIATSRVFVCSKLPHTNNYFIFLEVDSLWGFVVVVRTIIPTKYVQKTTNLKMCDGTMVNTCFG
jgi:hypothetical protein